MDIWMLHLCFDIKSNTYLLTLITNKNNNFSRTKNLKKKLTSKINGKKCHQFTTKI